MTGTYCGGRPNDQSISDGDTNPSPSNGTDFGSEYVSSGSVTRSFKIYNTGDANLNLTGTPKVAISGCSGFSILSYPNTPVVPGGSRTFSVEFNPDAVGLCSAAVSIENDDANEDPYNFTIQGIGLLDAPLDVTISHIEVTQVIQTINQSIPLIEGKPSLVRVYVKCGEKDCSWIDDNLLLYGWKGSNPLPSSPQKPINNNYQPSNNDFFDQRKDLNRSLNFILPFDWLSGELLLKAVISKGSTLVEEPKLVNFITLPEISIAWVAMNYDDNGTITWPNISSASNEDWFLENIFPVSNLNYKYYYQYGFHTVMDKKFSRLSKNEYKHSLNVFWDWLSQNDAWKYDSPPNWLYGWVPSQAATGLLGSSDPSWLDGGGEGNVAAGLEHFETTFAHEIGHLLDDDGLRHAPNNPNHLDNNCDDETPGEDEDFPEYEGLGYPIGSIGTFGVNVTDQYLFNPQSTYDFMTYCKPKWISPYNYEKIIAGVTSSTSEKSLQLQSSIQNAASEHLLVSGFVESDINSVTFDPMYIIESTVPAENSSGSTYCLETLDNSNNILDSNCFELSFIDDETLEPISIAYFSKIINFPSGTSEVRMTNLGENIGYLHSSSHNPTIQIKSPNSDKALLFNELNPISWDANDLDGDQLFFAISYSNDGGLSWTLIDFNITTTSYNLDVSNLPGGSDIVIRVTATDGINTSEDETNMPLTVGNKKPFVSIKSPSNFKIYFPGTPILLVGTAYDLEDAELDQDLMKWVSSEDGFIGSGSSLFATLTSGYHVLTFSAEDNDGNYMEASESIFVGHGIYLPLAFSR